MYDHVYLYKMCYILYQENIVH
uniref:Uncharacterized protein n=1 Tax=Anguilla anguilla TaxID=7936 RepID=A0A0E9UR10_ANGAN